MKRAIFAACILALIAPIAGAWQTDTNATTSVTTYTPARPSDILIGKQGGTNNVWIAVGQTTNDWVKVSNN